jgi:mRNA-degrading endonuclease RelE of RelBE toxin-antitoxin system
MEETGKVLRVVRHTDEFDEFYKYLDAKVQNKFDRTIDMICTVYPISTKYIKKLINSDLYEMRVSVGYNEYRTILFSTNHPNIIEATEIILLNGFLKKSNKDYDKQIKKAEKIINDVNI